MIPPPLPVAALGIDDVLAHIDDHLEAHLSALEDLVRIPSISGEPAHRDDLSTSAIACARLLRQAGLDDVEVVRADGGAPAVLGRAAGVDPQAPTVLLYAHHDVQPVGPGWSRAPFDPSREDGRCYGRGIADDKAGVMVHVAAIAAWVATRGAPPVHVAVLFEGEEEIGSPTLPALLATHRDRIDADALVACDGLNHGVGTPSLTCFLRGRVDAEITLAATRTDVHSGVVGGLVRDPLLALCQVLASCVDQQGEIAIDGFADDAHRPTAAERARLTELGFDEPSWREDVGVHDGVVLGGGDRHPLEALWLRPALSVEGIDAPSVEGSASIQVAAARARISVRLAPGQSPSRARDALVRHLTAAVPWGLTAEVIPGDALPPFRCDPATRPARATLDALSAGYGVPAVATGVGGSIPFVAQAAEALGGIPALITAVADPRTNAHGPDESLEVAGFRGACRAEAVLLATIGAALHAEGGRER
ncbi:MAG: M20/M25/M40 family metallo-hydrolase [Nitriliruptoraceae bacterium]